MYCLVSFNYGHAGDSRKATRLLFEAERKVAAACEKLEIDSLLAHSYPDGSLYRYMRFSSGEMKERLDQLRAELAPSSIFIEQVHEAHASEDPHKAGCNTLEEYFKKKRYL